MGVALMIGVCQASRFSAHQSGNICNILSPVAAWSCSFVDSVLQEFYVKLLIPSQVDFPGSIPQELVHDDDGVVAARKQKEETFTIAVTTVSCLKHGFDKTQRRVQKANNLNLDVST